MSIDDQEKYIREYLSMTRSHFATYHNHKEQLSYLATGLYLTVTLALFFQKSLDETHRISSPFLAFVAIAVFTLITYLFVWRQLLLRSVSDKIIAACDKQRLEWIRAFPPDTKLCPKVYKPYAWLSIDMPEFLYEKIPAKESKSVIHLRRLTLGAILFDCCVVIFRLFVL